jgi:hypothetical protein
MKIMRLLTPSLQLVHFKPDVQLPESNFTVSINGDGNITAVSTPTYRSNFDTSGVGFDNAPEIIVSPSDGGGDTASITAAIDSNGKVSGFHCYKWLGQVIQLLPNLL